MQTDETCNKVWKRTQHVTPNNIGSCWPTMLRSFDGRNKSQHCWESLRLCQQYIGQLFLSTWKDIWYSLNGNGKEQTVQTPNFVPERLSAGAKRPFTQIRPCIQLKSGKKNRLQAKDTSRPSLVTSLMASLLYPFSVKTVPFRYR